MLYLEGQVQNVFRAPEGKNQETGEVYGGQYKVQLQVLETMRNGETRLDLQTLTTDEPEKYKSLQGKTVLVPVGAFAQNSGRNVPVRLYKRAGDVFEGGIQGLRETAKKRPNLEV